MLVLIHYHYLKPPTEFYRQRLRFKYNNLFYHHTAPLI